MIPADFAWLAGLGVFLLTVGVGYLLIHRPKRPVPYSIPALRSIQYPQPATPDPFHWGGFGERRTSIRRQGVLLKVAVADAHPQELEHGWVLDRSMGGLGLSLSKPLELGTILKVRPHGAGDVAGWVEVTVRSCQAKNEHWKVGCQFVRTPPWNILLMFG